jgi:undecaprenyl phosphate N,N'-diacetylbacillosamine 1-phosphate transferase
LINWQLFIKMNLKMYKSYFKRIFDLLISIPLGLIFLIIIIPLVILILVIEWDNPFFLQVRPGFNDKHFILIKLRTMKTLTSTHASEEMRISKVGKFLRKYSLDELPQIYNVIKGDMSLVGPRPLLTEYLTLYTSTQNLRHTVKPGITGWAQINGRNTISWQEKFDLDVWYVNNISFALDLKILIKTIKKVLISEGINAYENKSVDIFNGRN